MPHETVPTGAARVRVMLKGTSSRPETPTYKDYTNAWFTDYTTSGKATQGKVIQGRVHPLTAKATHRVVLPIEYVTDYNLAGGEGLTYTIRSTTNPTLMQDEGLLPALGGVQPPGVTGGLRFGNSHSNDQSGYYNSYKILGLYHATYNPQTKNLQKEVDNTFGAGNYFIPTQEQWWGVFESNEYRFFRDQGKSPNQTEIMAVGLDGNILRQAYLSDYSEGFTSPQGGDDETDSAVFYAIRFKARDNNSSPVNYASAYDAMIGSRKDYTYPSAPDNSFKCAYRFTRVGGNASWNKGDNRNLTNQLVIDVVYLGEEALPTSLDAISDARWWDAKKSQGAIFTKTFPACGFIRWATDGVSGWLRSRGGYAGILSSTPYNGIYVWQVSGMGSRISTDTQQEYVNGGTVRLFLDGAFNAALLHYPFSEEQT